ncbi:uncharacterized protein [Asterias amurensis]|uniref:uncharacterized protein isoform X1 n=1 Tax=Asterias amurensis TaxID=7602 RepID=UPI003AB4F638
MTQTKSSRKRNRDLEEETDLLPSPKRNDFNLNSALLSSNHLNGLNGTDELDDSRRYVQQNGACFNGQSAAAAQPHCSSDQNLASSVQPHHVNGHLPSPHNNNPQHINSVNIDSSTCTALSNLNLVSGEHGDTPSEEPTGECTHYETVNRVLRNAHFARLERMNGTFREDT